MMKQKLISISFLLFVCFFCSCSSKSEDKKEIHSSEKSSYSREKERNYKKTENISGCRFEDGTYSATVDYSNSRTNYSTTYTLDVEVEDCQIIQINFPNGGYADDDHISPSDLDEDGNASVEGENGKSYQIQIED